MSITRTTIATLPVLTRKPQVRATYSSAIKTMIEKAFIQFCLPKPKNTNVKITPREDLVKRSEKALDARIESASKASLKKKSTTN